jgi:branched-chain amino acid transport system substrate-binding protein
LPGKPDHSTNAVVKQDGGNPNRKGLKLGPKFISLPNHSGLQASCSLNIMKKVHLISCACTLLGLLLVLPGCARPNDDVIRVGEYASLTGREATFGQMSHLGTRLAIDEINAAGGVLDKPIQLITEDTQSKAGESATVVRRLISRNRVVAVLGEVASSRSMEAAPICQQQRIPMISPSSTNVRLTQLGDYIFRVCFTDAFQGRLLANFAERTLQVNNVAMLTDVKSDYSVGLSRDFKAPFIELGGRIVTEQSYSGGDRDFKAQLTAIRAANPEAIFIPGYYTEVGLIAQQARQLGINIPLFGGDGWESSKLIEIGGKSLEGTYFSTHFSPEDERPEAVNFVAKFQAQYGRTPDAMAALGYDSALILADAIRRAGNTEPQALRDAIAETRDFPAVTGRITLDENRNASKSAVILTVRDGQFRYVETIEP